MIQQRSYRFGSSYLHLVFGDITTSDADVLVSSDDYYLTMGGGVSAALGRAAGEALLIDVAKRAPVSLGDVVITTAGALSAKHIFHVITIGPEPSQELPAEIVEKATRKCLSLLSEIGLSSIAFPAIGTGAAEFDTKETAIKMAEVISEFLKKRNSELHVSIYLYDSLGLKAPFDYIDFFEQFASRISAPESLRPLGGSPTMTDTREPSVRGARTQQLSELNREREQIEARLSKINEDSSGDLYRCLENRLDEIHKERLSVLKALQASASCGARLFVSYSRKDTNYLSDLREQIRALERTGLVTAWHDRLIGVGTEWEGVISDELEKADVILLLISPSFVDSKYCFEIELTRALERHAKKEALVVPILIRPVSWEDLPFAKLAALPSCGRPISIWDNTDLAWVDVIESLKKAIHGLKVTGKKGH